MSHVEVIKRINNNVAFCLDNNQNELIAFGKGIGFPKLPYTLTDLSKIDRTYYGIDSQYIQLLNEIPAEIIDLTAKIIDMAQSRIMEEIPPKVLFALADHINFAVERYEKNIVVKIPIYYDLQQFYQQELEIGRDAVKLINKEMKVYLPKEDAFGIALHFIDTLSHTKNEGSTIIDDEAIIDQLATIVDDTFEMRVDRDGINFARFVSHVQYLLKRKKENQALITENRKMYSILKGEYPATYVCVKKMAIFLDETINWNISDEERFYLMLHVNRLCAREDVH